MKVEDIRNVGIVGHGGSGKTLLAEAMLFSAGVTNRMGTIEDGNTVSDFHNQEIQRQISITTAMMHLPWRDHKINLIDTPGFLDFVGDVYGAMHVVDTGLLVVDGSHGIEVGTEICWKYGKEHELSKIIVVNKCDKEDIPWERLMADFKEFFGPDVVMVQFPYNSGQEFNAVVDLLRGKLLVFAADGSGKFSEQEIPPDALESYKAARVTFMESIIEHDEELMNKYLSDEPVSEEELKKALSHACRHSKIYPVVCCSAKRNVGVSRILDILVNYGASASDLPDMQGRDESGKEIRRPCDPAGPLAALIFKTVSEPHVGELSFVKVYSGALKVGSDVWNPSTRCAERIASLFLLNGKERKDATLLECGDMGAIIKLRNSHTNNTLCAPNAIIELQPIAFPEPVIRSALVALNKGDDDRLAHGLASLHQEDPTFHFGFDPELRQTIVSGQGELQLDVIVTRLKNRFNVETELVEPRIPYRETITRKADVRRKYKKQTGGRGQYADVHLEIQPLPRGEGFVFVDDIVGGVIPGKYVPAVEKGVRGAMEEGYHLDSRIVDVSARVFDGSYHAVDSSDLAFQIAGAQAFKECMEKAGAIILEPIYQIEVRVPEEYLGAVMGDLSGRRGKVQGMDSQGKLQIVRAEVPLAELYKYSSALRSMTQGRGMHSRSFSHYEPVPREVQKKLVEAHQAFVAAQS